MSEYTEQQPYYPPYSVPPQQQPRQRQQQQYPPQQQQQYHPQQQYPPYSVPPQPYPFPSPYPYYYPNPYYTQQQYEDISNKIFKLFEIFHEFENQKLNRMRVELFDPSDLLSTLKLYVEEIESGKIKKLDSDRLSLLILANSDENFVKEMKSKFINSEQFK